MLGLKLETYIKSSQDCLNSIVYAVDDGFYFYNNLTDFNPKAWEAPMMNMTRLISGNLTSSITLCFKFGYDSYDWAVKKY